MKKSELKALIKEVIQEVDASHTRGNLKKVIKEMLSEWLDLGPPCKHCGKPNEKHLVRMGKGWGDWISAEPDGHEYEPDKSYKPMTDDEREASKVLQMYTPDFLDLDSPAGKRYRKSDFRKFYKALARIRARNKNKNKAP